MVLKHPEESLALGEGRARERADVLDFVRSPPGRLPERLRPAFAEFARAIERGAHVGYARRLYENTEQVDWRNVSADVLLARLVTAGVVTESELDDLAERIEDEREEQVR